MGRFFTTLAGLLLVGSLGISGVACARSQITPNWVDHGSHPDYQGPRYLTALGEGQTSTDADKLAFLRLGEQLKVDISGSTAIAKAYSSSTDSETFSQDVNLNVAARVDLKDIKGVRIIERHHDAGANLHYSFAVLDKSAAASQLAVEISDLQARMEAGIGAARKLLAEDPSSAFRTLGEVEGDLPALAERLAEYSLFGGAKAYSDKLTASRAVEQQLLDLAGDLARGTQILAVGADRQTAAVGQGVARPFEVRFEFRNGANVSALKNVPVAFVADEQALTLRSDAVTNSSGVAALHVQDVSYTETELNEIQMGLGYTSPRVKALFPAAKVYVSVPRKSRTIVQIVIDIEGINPLSRKTIEDGIKELLLAENYSLVGEDAGAVDFRVQVEGVVSELPGMGRIKFANIVGSVKLISARSQKLIDTLMIDSNATKGGGLELDRAAQKSASKLVDALKGPLLKAMESNVGRS